MAGPSIVHAKFDLPPASVGRWCGGVQGSSLGERVGYVGGTGTSRCSGPPRPIGVDAGCEIKPGGRTGRGLGRPQRHP